MIPSELLCFHIFRLRNQFDLYSQGVAGHQGASRASRGEKRSPQYNSRPHLNYWMQDAEEFTPLHPDVLSAPEMADWVQSGKKKIGEVEMIKINHHRHGGWQEDLPQVVQGQVVLRRERPAIFCLVSSLFCCLLAVIGMQVGLGELWMWWTCKSYGMPQFQQHFPILT